MRRKENITLNSKILTAHFTGGRKIITLSLIILMLSFVNIIFNTNSISALSYQSEVGIGFTFNPTLSISLSSSDLIISNLTPGTTSDSNSVNVNVATNNAYGYSLYASVGDNTYNNTNLTHANEDNLFSSITTNAYISSLDTDNTWGYSYSIDNGANWTPYNGLPLYSSSQNRLTLNTEPAEDTVDFKIAAKANTAQASGTYSNVINFSVIATVSPMTLAEAYQSENKELYHGYYKMQDMTSTICEKTEDINAQLQVIDIRDDKVYWIAKLADGHCWMAQNLGYSITKDENNNIIPLTSEDTDLNEFGDHNYTTRYGYAKDENNVIYWTPENATIDYTGDNATSGGWANNTRKPYSANRTDDTAIGHDSRGNYYNWPATIATNYNNFSTDTTSDVSQNPKNSICPKGWRLPTISNQSEMIDGSTNEFSRLNYLYNNNASDTNTSWLAAPLYFVKRGFSINNGTGNGYYWSSSLGVNINGNIYPMILYLHIGTISMEANGASAGFLVRCLAR